MFDFGFWELALVAVVALLVVGPQRLPALASQVGRYTGKIQGLARDFRRQIESEANLQELSKTVAEQKKVIGQLQTDINGVASPSVEKLEPAQDIINTAIQSGRYTRQ